MSTEEYDPITLEILWNRLIAISDEAAAALVRTSFSSTVRESNDYACVLLDANGDTLAENRGSIPSFCGCVARTMRHFMERFPLSTWQAGDVVITNDPWMGTGHRPDFTMATPIIQKGKLVGFAGSIAHSPDIGGVLWSADCTEVFEEGLGVPPLRFYRAGKLNEEFVEIFRANCRVPDQSIGDLQAMVASGEVMVSRVIELLEDQNLTDLSLLGSILQSRAEAAMRKAIRTVPSGTYRSVVNLDGFDAPIKIACALTVADDEITIDYTGTSPEVNRGINSSMNYTWAYSTYPIKCALDPESPKNEGSYRPIKITAPEGSIVNARFPRAVNARHLVAHTLSAAIYQALAQARPDLVIADSGSAPTLRSVWSGTGHDGERFSFILFANGGMGARPTKDGLPCTPFPTNSTCASIEVMESVTPLIVHAKQIRPGSGGAGRWRGGYGQEIIIQVDSVLPVALSVISDRGKHPPLGLLGGGPAAPVDVQLLNREGTLPRKARTTLQPGDVVALKYAGGGGYGDAKTRDRDLVRADLRNGVIDAKTAREIYGLSDTGAS